MRKGFCGLLLTLYLLAVDQILPKVQAASSIQARQSVAKVTEGSDFKFEWDFDLQSGDKGNFREIMFGLWEKGYTSSYFITVKKLGVVIENPQLSKKHPSYVGRVHWVGDISKSYVAFRLTDVKLSDNNTYGCTLDIGGFGQTIDSKITLIVEEAAVMNNVSTFVHFPQPKLATVGHAADFNWGYRLSDEDRKAFKAVQLSYPTYNHHKHKVLWRRDNNGNQITYPEYASRLLVSNETKVKRHNYHQTKRYRFKLSKVTLQDEGYYEFKIELENTRKNLKSRVLLEVNEYPRIKNFPQVRGPYKVGEQLVLVCEAEGKPPPTISWIRNGQIVPDETENYYHVKNVSISDAGVYSCCASNLLGNVTSPGVLVHVQYAPTIISPSGTQTVVLSWKGNPTRLKCEAVGYPDAVYSWKRGDSQLIGRESGNGSVLTMTPSADSDFTNYTCIAKNLIGQDSTTFTLKPIRPPSQPIITNIEVNYNAIKVTWQSPPSKQNTPITGYVLKIKKTLGQGNKWEKINFKAKSDYFILGNLSRRTHYRVCLYATNVAGRSNASEERQVTTPIKGRPGLPTLHLKNVKINHTRFLVTWNYPDDNGGAKVNMFTVWYRTVTLMKNTQEKWSTVNVTHNSCSLKLNCCLTYEIMVTAWNRNGPSFTDPDNATRVAVLRDLKENAILRSTTTSKVLEPKGSSSPEESKMKVVLKYLPYVSFLALPVLFWFVRSKICKRTHVKLIKINEDDMEQPEDEVEEIEIAPVTHIKSWEFPRSNLAIERVIGNGAFGVVSKAYARDLPDKPDWSIVAVKSLQDDATESERKDLFSELNLLKKLKPHPHIIKLLDFPYVIIEYVPYGDLLGYLRRSRGVSDCYYDDPEIKPMTNLTSEQLLKFAWQIADGMRYISSKKIIHRDLAARNVLVGENHRCKITDFGMARDVDVEEIYLRRSEGRIPVKWTAIEAITGAMKYSTKSDVWSFGVALFEICTIGAEPYPGISPYKLPSVLLKGYRIPKPAYFKDELYDIMLKCWETEPENRPSFDSLCSSIRGLEILSNQNYVNIKDCLEAYENENNT
ncbi:hypothetical protein ACROYT_G028515 [Oculina patagonica]